SWSSRTPTSPSPSSIRRPSWRRGAASCPAPGTSSWAGTRSAARTWGADMERFVQLAVDGLATGSIYALLALAIVLVHRATGLINFAQGSMAVFSTYVAFAFVQSGLPVWLAIVCAVVGSFVFGAFVERVVIRRFEGGSHDVAVVVTVGLFVLLAGLSGTIWSYNHREFPSLFPLESVSVGGAHVGLRNLGTIVVTILVMGLLQLLFLKTKLGLALRAVSGAPTSAAL